MWLDNYIAQEAASLDFHNIIELEAVLATDENCNAHNNDADSPNSRYAYAN